MTDPDAVKVEQADRESAAKFIDRSDGDFEELSGLFAHHRHAATQSLLDRIAELEGALRGCVDACEQWLDASGDEQEDIAAVLLQDAREQAIAALDSQKGEG